MNSLFQRNHFLQRLGKVGQQFLLCSSAAGGQGQQRELVRKEMHADGTIARLVLNVPERRNPLSLAMMSVLSDQLLELDRDKRSRAVILAAEGPVFSAGHDLKEIKEADPAEHNRIFAKCIELMERVQRVRLPVIAEVDGLVTAAGSQLVASCDIVVASESSTFGCPGLRIGLFCSTPGVAMARNLPRKLALDMLFTARAISAKEALAAGLVSRVVAPGECGAEAMRVAEAICEMSKSVCALGKEFFYRQIQLDLQSANRQGAAVMCDNLRYKDAQEGISAFLEKRGAQWTHSDQKAI